MNQLRPTVPTVFDYVDLRLRMPVRRADDPFLASAGLGAFFRRML